jgi:hypothetical protein
MGGLLKRSAPAMLAVVALLPGCGGGDERAKTSAQTAPRKAPGATAARIGPRPVETAQQAADRIATAIRRRDCSSPDELFAFGEVTPGVCRTLLAGIAPAPRPNTKAYGSAAMVQRADGGRTILALDRDRRFKFVTTFGPSDFPVVPIGKADEAMSWEIGAIRRDNCPDIVRLALTYSNGGSGKKFCALKPVRQLHTALERHYTASPKLLGGDGSFAFYGLSAKPHYYTLVFAAYKARGWSGYLFVTSIQA